MKKRYEEQERSSSETVDEIVRNAEREAVPFGPDSNDESDWNVDDWTTSEESERDLYGRGRFDR